MNDEPQTGGAAAGGSTADQDGETTPASRPAGAGEPHADPGGAERVPADAADGLAAAFQQMRERLDAHMKRNDLQQRAFDTLHDELQQYKNAFLLNEFQRPVIRNLIDLYDRLLRIEEALPRIGERTSGPTVEEFAADIGRFIGNMTGFRHALTEVLARLEVESYDDRHDAFRQKALQTLDAKLHRAVDVEPTDDPERNNRVARTHKHGFYWRERGIRPQEVTVLRYEKPARPAETNDE